MELFPGTPDIIEQAPAGEKRLVEVNPCFDAMGEKRKQPVATNQAKSLKNHCPTLSDPNMSVL